MVLVIVVWSTVNRLCCLNFALIRPGVMLVDSLLTVPNQLLPFGSVWTFSSFKSTTESEVSKVLRDNSR